MGLLFLSGPNMESLNATDPVNLAEAGILASGLPNTTTYTITLNDASLSAVTVLVTTTSPHVELRVGETASWGKAVQVVIPADSIGGLGISEITLRSLDLNIANGEAHAVRILHSCETEDPLFINSTTVGWLSVLDNDVAEVVLFPAAVELSEQTEDEWLSAVEGVAGRVITIEVSLPSMPEEGDVVTVTLTSSDGAALKLGSLESCASGDKARGDLDVACMQGYAFVSFSVESQASKSITLWAPYDNVADTSRSFTLFPSVTSTSPAWDNLQLDGPVPVTVTDEDIVGIYIGHANRPIDQHVEPFVTREGVGQPIGLTVFLLSKPLDELECSVIETYVSGATHPDLSGIKQLDVRPAKLNILPTSFARPIPVFISSVKEGLADGTVTVTLAWACSCKDPNYNTTFDIAATFVVEDSDTAGMRVLRSDGTTTEGGSPVALVEGGAASVSIQMFSRPYCNNCHINLTVDMSPGPVVPSVSSFQIEPASWGKLLKLDLSVPEDNYATGTVTQTITLTLDTEDVIYGALPSVGVEVNIEDNDILGLEFRPSAMTLYEGRGPAALEVRLTSRPLDNSVAVTLNDIGVGGAAAHGLVVDPAAVYFGSSFGRWDRWQAFNLSKAQDTKQTGSQTADVCLEVASDDTLFAKLPKFDPARCTEVTFIDDELADPVSSTVTAVGLALALPGSGTGVTIPPSGAEAGVAITMAELAPSKVAAASEFSSTVYNVFSKLTAFTPHGTKCSECIISVSTFASTTANLVLLRAADEESPVFEPVQDAYFYFLEGDNPDDRIVVGEAAVQTFSVFMVTEMRPQVVFNAGAGALSSHLENSPSSLVFPGLELLAAEQGVVVEEYGLFEVTLSLTLALADYNGTSGNDYAEGQEGREQYDGTDELAIDCLLAMDETNSSQQRNLSYASLNETGADDDGICSASCAECMAALELLDESAWDSSSNLLTLRPKATKTNASLPDLPASTYFAAIRGLVFKNPSDNPDPTSRRVTLGLVENHGGTTLRMDRPSVISLDFGIEAVNDPPAVILRTSRLTYEEASGAVFLDTKLVVGDPDSPTYASAIVWISGMVEGESLAVTQQAGEDVDVAWSISTVETEGDAVFLSSGVGGFMSRAGLQTALRSVTFRSDTKRHVSLERLVSIAVNDGALDSDIQTLAIDIQPKNDPPFFLDNLISTFSTKEDEAKLFHSAVRDPEWAVTTVDIMCQGQLGTVTVLRRYCIPSGCENTTGLCRQCSFDFEYTPRKDMHGRDTFVVQASDGEALSLMQAFQFLIEPLNDPPVVTNYSFAVNVGEMRTGPAIHLQGSDPDGEPIAYFQIWPVQEWTLRDITYITLPPVLGYDMQVEDRPRGGPEITFYVPPSANPPVEERFAYRAYDETGTMSNIGFVSVTVRNPKQSSEPPIALDETKIAPEGQLLRSDFNFDHPLGRFGVSPTFSIVQCPRLGALWIDDDGTAGEYTYRPHPFIADENMQTEDDFTFQVRLAGCDTCRDDATITARVKPVSRPPELMCEGVSSLISGAVGGADIPESIPPALRCGDPISALMDNATRSWGVRAAAFLLDPIMETQDGEIGVTSRAVDAALLIELLLKPAGRGNTTLQDASMAAGMPSVIQAIDIATGNRIAAIDRLKTTIQDLQPGGSCVAGACDMGVSMACWEESTIEVPMSTGDGSRWRAIALAGFSPSTSAPAATYIATLPTSGLLLRPMESEVWNEYAAGEEVPAPYVVAFEPRPDRRGLPYDSFTFNLTAQGNSTVGVVHLNVRCAPGYTVKDEWTCAPCPVGYRGQPGVTDQLSGSCTPCPPGTFNAEAGATECTPCPIGEFQSEEAQPSCASCPLNSVTDPGATSADGCVCKKGYYGDPNNPPPGRTDGCIRCRDLAWAQEPENKGKLPMCVCDTVGQPIPLPLAGWWVNPTDVEDIKKCRPKEACVGWSSSDLVLQGRCGPSYEDQRYTGDICAKCADNFYREEGTSLCRTCPDNPWIAGLLIGALLLLGGPFLLKMVKLQRGFGAINIALSFAQLMSLFQRFEWKWPDEIKAWMAWLGIVNLDLNLVRAECLADITFVHKFGSVMAVPVVIGIVLFIRVLINRLHVFAVSKLSIDSQLHIEPPEESSESNLVRLLKQLARSARNWIVVPLTEDEMRDLGIASGAAFFLSLSWTYFALASTLSDFFNCKEENGRWSLVFEPSSECWNFEKWNWWSYTFVPAIVCVLLYPVGILAFFASMLYRNRALLRSRASIIALESKIKVRRALGVLRNPSAEQTQHLNNEEQMLKRFKSKERELKKQIGFLFRRYNDDYFWWECINLSKKGTIVGSHTFFKAPIEQNLVVQTALILYVISLCYSKPYDKKHLDIMDCFANIAANIILFCGLLFYADLLESYQEETVILLLQSLIVGTYVGLAVFIVYDVAEAFRDNAKVKWKRFKAKARKFVGKREKDVRGLTRLLSNAGKDKREVKSNGVWMDAGGANILQQVVPFVHPIFLKRLALFLGSTDEDGEVRAARAMESLLVLMCCRTGLERLHGQYADVTVVRECPCGKSHDLIKMDDEPPRSRFLDHPLWVAAKASGKRPGDASDPHGASVRYHFNKMEDFFGFCHLLLHKQMRKWTLLNCVSKESYPKLSTSLMFAQSDTERSANAELDKFCAEVMQEYSAVGLVRWVRALQRWRQRRRIVPELAYAVTDETQRESEVLPPRDVEVLRKQLVREDKGYPEARKAFDDLIDEDMKPKMAYYAGVKTNSEGHETFLTFLTSLGRAYEQDSNESRWYRQLLSLRTMSRSTANMRGGSSLATGVARMLSVLLMFTFAAGAAAQGLPCQCSLVNSEEQAALCDNMLTGGAQVPDVENLNIDDLCRSSTRTRDTHCLTQEDTPMLGLLVSPFGIPAIKCNPRMGDIEINPEPVNDMYIFTYTPFEGEPLVLAESVDLFTFERATEQGGTELRLMTIKLRGVNDPPVAVEDGSGQIVVTFNFNDRKPTSQACWESFTQDCYDSGEGLQGELQGSDAEGDAVNFYITSQPPNAIACAGGDVKGGGREGYNRRAANACLALGIGGNSFFYLPAPGSSTDSFMGGEESFQYMVMDDGGGVHHAGGRGTSTLGACGSVIVTRAFSTCAVDMLPSRYTMDEDQEGGLIGRFKRGAIHPDLRPYVRFQVFEEPSFGSVDILCGGEEVEDCATCGDVSLVGSSITREACFLYTPFTNQHGNETFAFTVALAPGVPTGQQEVCKVSGGIDLVATASEVSVRVLPVVDPPTPRSSTLVSVPMRSMVDAAPPPAPPPPPLAPGERAQTAEAVELFGDFYPIVISIEDPDRSGEPIVLQLSLTRPLHEGSFLYPELSPEVSNGTGAVEDSGMEAVLIDWSRPLHSEMYVSDPEFPTAPRPPEGSFTITLPANGTGLVSFVMWYQAPPLVFGEPLEEFEFFAERSGLRGRIQKVQLRVQCSPGYHKSPLGVCSLCLPGTYTREYGYEQCELCRKGTSSGIGATACIPCQEDFYAPSVGTPECIQCPFGSITRDPGAQNITECLCDVGFYGQRGGPCYICPNPGWKEKEVDLLMARNAPPTPASDTAYGAANASEILDTERAEAEALVDQLEGEVDRTFDIDRRWTICEVEDLRWPLPAKGHWVDARAVPITTRICIPELACNALNASQVDLVPGERANCKRGYGYDACSRCLPQYYRLYGECTRCPDRFGPLGLWLGIGMVFLFPLIRQVITAVKALPALSISISFAQILAFIGEWELEWPFSMDLVFQTLSFLNLNFEVAHPECEYDYGFFDKYLTTMLLPIAVFAVLAGFAALSGLHMLLMSRLHAGGRIGRFLEENRRVLTEPPAELWNPLGFANAMELTVSSTAFPNLDEHCTNGKVLTSKERLDMSLVLREAKDAEMNMRADANDPAGILCPGAARRTGKLELFCGTGPYKQGMARRFVMAHYSDSETGEDDHDAASFEGAMAKYKGMLVADLDSGVCHPPAFWRSVLLLGLKSDPDMVARAPPMSDRHDSYVWSEGPSVRCLDPLYDDMSDADTSIGISIPDVQTRSRRVLVNRSPLSVKMRRLRQKVQTKLYTALQASGSLMIVLSPFYDFVVAVLDTVENVLYVKSEFRPMLFLRKLVYYGTLRTSMETWTARVHTQCRIFVIFLHLGYVLFAANALNAIDCVYNEGNDKYYLQREPSILCYEGEEWDRLFPYAVIFNVLYPVGIPCVFGVLLWMIRGHLDDPVVIRVMGPIYTRFKDEWYGFECVVLLRKQVIVAISIMFSGSSPNTELQRAIIGMSVSFAAMLLQVIANPYANEQLSRLEVFSIGGHFFYIFAGVIFLADSLNEQKNLANPQAEPREVMSDGFRVAFTLIVTGLMFLQFLTMMAWVAIEVVPGLSSHKYIGGIVQRVKKKLLRKKKATRRVARNSTAAVLTAGLKAMDAAENAKASISPAMSDAAERMRGASRRMSSGLSTSMSAERFRGASRRLSGGLSPGISDVTDRLRGASRRLSGGLSPGMSDVAQRLRNVSRRSSEGSSRESPPASPSSPATPAARDGQGRRVSAQRGGAQISSFLSRLQASAKGSTTGSEIEPYSPSGRSLPPPLIPAPAAAALDDDEGPEGGRSTPSELKPLPGLEPAPAAPSLDEAAAQGIPPAEGLPPGSSNASAPGPVAESFETISYIHTFDKYSMMETFTSEAAEPEDMRSFLQEAVFPESMSSALMAYRLSSQEYYSTGPEDWSNIRGWVAHELGMDISAEDPDELESPEQFRSCPPPPPPLEPAPAPGPLTEAFVSPSAYFKRTFSTASAEESSPLMRGEAAHPFASSSSHRPAESGASSPGVSTPGSRGSTGFSGAASRRLLSKAPRVDRIINRRDLPLRDLEGVNQNMCCFCESEEDGSRYAVFSERMGMDGVEVDGTDAKDGDLYLPGGRGIQIRRHKLEKGDNPVKEHYHDNIAFRPVFARILTALSFVDKMLLGRGAARSLNRRGRRLARILDRQVFFRVQTSGGDAKATGGGEGTSDRSTSAPPALDCVAEETAGGLEESEEPPPLTAAEEAGAGDQAPVPVAAGTAGDGSIDVSRPAANDSAGQEIFSREEVIREREETDEEREGSPAESQGFDAATRSPSGEFDCADVAQSPAADAVDDGVKSSDDLAKKDEEGLDEEGDMEATNGSGTAEEDGGPQAEVAPPQDAELGTAAAIGKVKPAAGAASGNGAGNGANKAVDEATAANKPTAGAASGNGAGNGANKTVDKATAANKPTAGAASGNGAGNGANKTVDEATAANNPAAGAASGNGAGNGANKTVDKATAANKPTAGAASGNGAGNGANKAADKATAANNPAAGAASGNGAGNGANKAVDEATAANNPAAGAASGNGAGNGANKVVDKDTAANKPSAGAASGKGAGKGAAGNAGGEAAGRSQPPHARKGFKGAAKTVVAAQRIAKPAMTMDELKSSVKAQTAQGSRLKAASYAAMIAKYQAKPRGGAPPKRPGEASSSRPGK